MLVLSQLNISIIKYFEIQFLEEKYQIDGSDCTPCKEQKKDVSESEGGFIGAKYDSLLFLETKETTSPKEMIQN